MKIQHIQKMYSLYRSKEKIHSENKVNYLLTQVLQSD